MVPPAVFNLAEVGGTGSQLCAWVGFAGSRGGALRLFFGTDDAGWECNTSLWSTGVSLLYLFFSYSVVEHHTYPADIRVQESPPNPVLPDLFHAATAIQKHGQHSLSKFNDGCVFFGLCRFSSIVGHTMLLGDRRNDESRVEINESLT